MTDQDSSQRTAQAEVQGPLEYLALAWVAIARKSYLLPAYAICMIWVAIFAGVFELGITRLIMDYLIVLPLGAVALGMGTITVILTIFGRNND